MKHHLAIARVWYEASSFTPVPTSLAQFKNREWHGGDDAVRFYRGTRTEIGAAVDFLDRHPHWHATFLRCAAASPGGPVIEQDLQSIFSEILDGIRATQADAVYLSLHGALFGERTLCADLELLRKVRGIIGRRPLSVTFDLHANVSPEVARYVDILVGYKTHPHIDMYEVAERALGLLDATLAGSIRPVVAISKVGAVLNSHNMRTASGPMADIEAIAEEARRSNPALLDVTPFGGFAYADTPCAGAAVSVVANADEALARTTADAVAREMRNRTDAFTANLSSAESSLQQATALLASRSDHRPVAVAEPADNPLSGGAGDTPGLLRAVLDHAGAARTLFAFFWDPDLVERCHRAGVGAQLRARFGARLTELYGPPVELEVTVERLTEGSFRNRGPMEAGLAMDLGRTALVRRGRLAIIVTSQCHAPNDIEYFRLHGIDLGEIDLLAVKAKNHFRAAFTPLCTAIIDADTDGPAMADLSRLPFRNLPPELLASLQRSRT